MCDLEIYKLTTFLGSDEIWQEIYPGKNVGNNKRICCNALL